MQGHQGEAGLHRTAAVRIARQGFQRPAGNPLTGGINVFQHRGETGDGIEQTRGGSETALRLVAEQECDCRPAASRLSARKDARRRVAVQEALQEADGMLV